MDKALNNRDRFHALVTKALKAVIDSREGVIDSEFVWMDQPAGEDATRCELNDDGAFLLFYKDVDIKQVIGTGTWENYITTLARWGVENGENFSILAVAAMIIGTFKK